MPSSYSIDLVVLSIVVAMVASYSALDLAARVATAAGRAAYGWLLSGAAVMGAGIWSMHFIGMLAFHLKIPLGYDLSLTLLSLVIAIITSGFALVLVSGKTLRVPVLLVGGLVMGVGICGMHYTGMAAMRMLPPIQYDPLLFSASVVVAVVASIAALWLAFSLRSEALIHAFEFKVLAAMVMGFAITGMHYTGMAAARFAPDAVCGAGASAFSPTMQAYSIAVAMGLIIGVVVSSAKRAPRVDFTKLTPEQLQQRESEVRLLRAGIALVGLIISLLAAAAMWTSESERVQEDFESAAKNHASDIIAGFDDSAEAVESLNRFFMASGQVTREEFETFTSYLRVRAPWAQALEWIPRVRGDRRQQFEEMRRQRFPGFRITQSNAQGGVSAATARAEYFPVDYVDPLQGNEAEVGFDEGSEPELRNVMDWARDTGGIATAGRVAMADGRPGFEIFMPVYAPGMPHDTVDQRRANLRGFAKGEFKIDQLVEQSIVRRAAAGLDLFLYGGPTAVPAELLYTHYSRTRARPGGAASHNGRRHVISFDTAGGIWTYVAVATPDRYVASVWGALLVFLGGLAATAFVDTSVRMKQSVFKLVQARQVLASHVSELKVSEDRFRSLVEQAGDAILLFSQQAKYLDVNQRATELLGYSREELVGADIGIVVTETERTKVAPELANVLAGRAYKSEWQMLRKDGSTFVGEVNAKLLTDGRVLLILREITDRKLQEDKLYRLNRIHAVLTGINALIVRVRKREDLFRQICQLLVERGHFKLAWIGLVENEAVRPLASYGADNGILKSLKISIRTDAENAENSCGPTALAMRGSRPQLSNDIANDERMRDWHEACRGLGIHSFLAMPLITEKKVVGCFNVYAAEPGFFNAAECQLLVELAANISYALEFIAKEEQLGYLAFYDPLTRLANRGQMLERLGKLVRDARQTHKPLAVLELDIENFKSINDAYGRDGGDEVLKKVAKRLSLLAGSPEHVARTTNDRFAIVLNDFQESADLVAFIETKLLPALNRPMKIGGRDLRLSVHTGIVRFAMDGDDADSLLRNAEAAVKKAKRSSERYLFYTEEIGAAFSEKLQLESQLRQAVEKQEFVLYYQPKVDLNNDMIVGAEALIRWNSPEHGLVPPTRFIPLLEETGMILPVGVWAMEQAIRDHRQWLAQGLPAPPVAVNVSAVQLRQKDFVETVRRVLSAQSSDRPCLDLELTESVLVGDIEELIIKLKTVRDLGVQIAIDDFGTGYSSLAYLARLPINTLKIDRSFVLRMGDSADTMSIVSTILTLAHSMNMKVVAEGVDSEEQLKFLRLLRCNQIQGWLFSKAVPADEFAQLLREGRRLGRPASPPPDTATGVTRLDPI